MRDQRSGREVTTPTPVLHTRHRHRMIKNVKRSKDLANFFIIQYLTNSIFLVGYEGSKCIRMMTMKIWSFAPPKVGWASSLWPVTCCLGWVPEARPCPPRSRGDSSRWHGSPAGTSHGMSCEYRSSKNWYQRLNWILQCSTVFYSVQWKTVFFSSSSSFEIVWSSNAGILNLTQDLQTKKSWNCHKILVVQLVHRYALHFLSIKVTMHQVQCCSIILRKLQWWYSFPDKTVIQLRQWFSL